MKKSVVWLLLALLTMLVSSTVCCAVEEDEDGNLRQSKMHTLDGEDPPPKPKVIVKERVVVQCAPGAVWSPRAKRCISEEGNEPVQRQQIEPPKDDRYVYPNTKLRFKVVGCSMKGETVTCKVLLTNTSEGSTQISFGNFTITDGIGKNYKNKSHYCTEHMNSAYTVNYGDSRGFGFIFPLVDPSATTVTFSGSVNANKGSDSLKFSGVQILK